MPSDQDIVKKYKNSFLEISYILNTYKQIWNNEVIYHYPNIEQVFPSDWLSYLGQLDFESLFAIDSNQMSNKVQHIELANFLSNINELKQIIPAIRLPEEQLPHWAFVKTKGKKQHEIRKLSSLISTLPKELLKNKVIDIGGGKGHLARILAHYKQTSCTVVECNQELVELGKSRRDKYPLPKNAKDLEFLGYEFGTDQEFENKLLLNNFVTGLHTCGPLALHHINALAAKSNGHCPSGIINVGCCYGKLSPKQDVNISRFAKETNLELSTYALNLATRSHQETDFESFKFKYKLKQFRYVFHILLYKHFDIKEFISIGDTLPYIGKKTFAEFAIEKINYLTRDYKIQNTFTENQLQDFFKENLPTANNIICGDLIRWKFGRLIELYILLDRYFYLIENGRHVEIHQIFDESLSPRNIGLVAY